MTKNKTMGEIAVAVISFSIMVVAFEYCWNWLRAWSKLGVPEMSWKESLALLLMLRVIGMRWRK